MTVTYHAGNRIQGTSTDFNGIAAIQGGWKELGRTTLGSANRYIDVTSLPNKRYYMILHDSHGHANTAGTIRVRYNTDNGTNYAHRRNANGGADGTSVNEISDFIGSFAEDTNPLFAVGYLSNLSSKEKLTIWHNVEQRTAGAGNAPHRNELVGKWTNTTDPLDEVQIFTGATNSYNTNSEVVVLGWDPADTHTTNFWEELADTTFTSSGVSAQTFTAKKYLWFQFWYTTDSSGNGQHFQLGDTGGIDTGSTYARRHSINGGSDGTSVNQSKIYFAPQLGARTYFVNMFMVNNASNEKLVIIHSASNNGAGAGNAPQRRETVGKWVETTNQCDRIKIATDSGTFTGGQLKVWGAD